MVVIGTLGYSCDRLTTHLKYYFDDVSAGIVQKTALLVTAHILRNLLS